MAAFCQRVGVADGCRILYGLESNDKCTCSRVSAMTDIVQILSDHPHIAVPLLILLMAAESAPLVGFFIPGVLILPALGAMTGTEIWPFWHIYFYAVAGALLGDILGYWLARSGRAEWTYRLRHHRYQQALKSAERLVGGRGALALALGRFAWFIHPAVPPAAGLLGVRPGQFFLIDTLATCLWVWVYLGLGHVVTGVWLEKSEYLIGMTSLLAVTILVIVLIKKKRSGLPRHRG
jgi:membrane protein DedA with SNARE-associated domain